MKKNLLSLLLIFAIFCAHAQTFVSTSPENKNIILEEFTGISCTFCPDGHKIGQQLHDANPNDIFLINIHTGGYASPQGPGTDFRVDPIGSNIAGQSNLSGYPAGTVNRHLFSMSQGGGTAMSRGDWSAASTQLMAQPSPVNVGLQANIDMASNTLTVDVEVYYTGSQPFLSSNKINVAVVQNGILGPQTGGSQYNPTAIDPATGLYTHNHMLRHMMTGQWGEDILTINQGDFWSNQYQWVMPANINGVVLDPTNIAVIAFVSEGQQEILSGTEVYPNIVFANQYDAYYMSSSAADIVCAPETDLEIKFRNYGNVPLTSLDIAYSINGGAATTYPWTGNLSSGGTETVIIPSISVTPGANNTVDFTLSNPNGLTDQNPSNNNGSATFAGLASAASGTVSIDVTTDQYANEVSWQLKDANGSIIAQATQGSMSNSSAQPTAYATINPNECYSFTMYDSYGDGLLSGGYWLRDANNTVIASMQMLGSYTSEQRTNFETGTAPPPPPASWNCVNGDCIDPGNGLGQYNSLTACQTACISTDINDVNTNAFSIYPNPVQNELYIDGDYDLINIYNIFGELVLSKEKSEMINTSLLSNGIYFVDIKSNEKNIIRKITISK